MYPQGLLAALLYAFAALLVLAGAVKLRRPETTASALSTARLPGGRRAVRGLGLAEMAVGLATFLWPAAMAAVVALFYASFAAFVSHVLARRLPLASCGCLGETDTEPSRVHLSVTAVAGVVGFVSTLAPPPSVPDLLESTPVAGAFFMATVGLACYLTYLILVSLPDAFAAYQQPVRSDD